MPGKRLVASMILAVAAGVMPAAPVSPSSTSEATSYADGNSIESGPAAPGVQLPGVLLPDSQLPGSVLPDVLLPGSRPTNSFLDAWGSLGNSTPTSGQRQPGHPAGSDVPTPQQLAAGIDVSNSVALASAAGITQGVIVMDRRTGLITASANAEEKFAAMSVMKLFIAADLLGSGAADDPATESGMFQMITASDDDAASLYYDQLGASAMVERVAARYELPGTEPAAREEWWGDVQTTPADLASFLSQALAQPLIGPWLGAAMTSSTDIANDGQNQNFGMNSVVGAGSKQGWGCCLSGVLSIHSVGFTANTIVVVLSKTDPGVAEQDSLMAATTATVNAGLGLSAATGIG